MHLRISNLMLAVPLLVSPLATPLVNPLVTPLVSPAPSNQDNGNQTRITSGNHIILDGTLAGYDLQIIQSKLDKPCPQWYTTFLAAGWPSDQWRIARWIIFRESRCDQYAWNGQDAGLLQINKIHRPLIESYSLRFPEDLYNPETNLWIAHLLWLRYGWEPWTYKGVIPK